MSATFISEEFKKVLRSFLLKWGLSWGFLMSSVVISILILLRSQNWQLPPSIGVGTLTIGKLLTIKSFAIGTNTSGIFAVGVNIVGLLAAGVNTFGIFAVGVNAAGFLPWGQTPFFTGVFTVGINTAGFFSIGYRAFGIYALSYDKKGKGRYLFSPVRQDAEAVTLFTRWLPELEDVFAPTS